MRQREERDLPRDAALAVGVVVELVDDRESTSARGALARARCSTRISAVAADDRRVAVHGRVAGHQPDVLGAERRGTSAKNFSFASALIGHV